MRIFFFRFAYLSAVWLQFGQNAIEIIKEINFALDFALIVTKQLTNMQNWKNISHFSKYFKILFLLSIYYLADKGKCF